MMYGSSTTNTPSSLRTSKTPIKKSRRSLRERKVLAVYTTSALNHTAAVSRAERRSNFICRCGTPFSSRIGQHASAGSNPNTQVVLIIQHLGRLSEMLIHVFRLAAKIGIRLREHHFGRWHINQLQ